MKPITSIFLLVVAFLLGGFVFRGCGRADVTPETLIRSDTVIVRDTIRPLVPKPIIVTVVRHDTVRAQNRPLGDTLTSSTATSPDTDTIPQITPENDIIIPITQKTYQTEDYTAVVEGYRPRLVSIELYPKTTKITNNLTKARSSRWALTVGPGVGYGPKGVQPYIGVNFGFVIWSNKK